MIKSLRTWPVVLGLVGSAGIAGSMYVSRGFAQTLDIVLAGTVVVDPAVTAVQHDTGGIIAEVRRRDGDRVKSGELLARLDDSAIRTNLSMSCASLDGLLARRARLEAERDGRGGLTFPRPLADRGDDAEARSAMQREQELFASRFQAKQAERDLQQVRIHLLEDEISGLEFQQKSKAKEVDLIQRELSGVRQLRDQNLVPLTRLTSLERDSVRLEAEQRGLAVSVAQAKGRIAEMQLQMVWAERDRSRDLINELHDMDGKLVELARQKADFEGQLRRADILAPQDGVVVSSAVHDAGSAVAAGERLMLIAAAGGRPSVEARVDVRSARHLRVGQQAKLVVAGGDAQAEFNGRLEKITPDQTEVARADSDDASVMVRVALADDASVAHFAHLAPGAPVSVSVPTTLDQSLFGLLAGLAKPLYRIERAVL